MNLKKRANDLHAWTAYALGTKVFPYAISDFIEQALKQVRDETIQECLDIWKSEHDCPDEDCLCDTRIRELKGKG